jgi:hypothetical protein
MRERRDPFTYEEGACASDISLHADTITSSHDYIHVVRGRIPFPNQVTMSSRFPKVLLTTAAPSFGLFRLLSLHMALLKYTKRPTPGSRTGVRPLYFHGTMRLV